MDRWYRRIGKLVAGCVVVDRVLALAWPRYRQYWRARVHLGRVWFDYYGSGGYVTPMASDMLGRASAQALRYEPREKSARDAFEYSDAWRKGSTP